MSRSRDLANLAGDATGLETLTVSDITDLTATATELNYVDGVSNPLQTQIDAKAPIASPTFTGTTNVSSGVTLPSNPTIVLGSNATLPAGTFIQAVTGTGANNSGVTHNGSTFTTLETLSTTITVNKGNKVLIIATGVPWYTSGTTNHNGIVRLRISDGINEGVTNGCILLTQNFGINNKRMYGSNHTGIMTTASGSGTVVVTATVQASTESGATVNYGDTNTLTALNYTLFEIQA